MSSMSRNNSVNSLMGFSIHQPSLGAPLQFFPAMGSKQLDEMIDAYIPGDASILEKRTAVTVEFFQYSITTNELFKFFMVYPTLGSTNTSPTMDSGYHSNFTTSPVMSESQWSNTPSQMVSPSTKTTPANDFSNIPGMKIMTKDGRDVTNSASRGCKTKEQRDHAHLMRIIKACDSCKRKKTKCDPSHKRSAAGTSSGKITKKTSKNPRPAAAPPQIAPRQTSTSIDFDQLLSETSPFDSFAADSFNVSTDGFTMEWDQFIQYPEEPTEAIPLDYNFFSDPAGFFSPATTASLESSFASPSQLPITPIEQDVNIADNTAQGHDHKPILPYLNPGGVEAGSNYVDFNLFSPQSSFLDEEIDFAKEVAASPIQVQQPSRHRHKRTGPHQVAASHVTAVELSDSAVYDEALCGDRQNVILDAGGDGVFHGISDSRNFWSDSTAVTDTTGHGGVLEPQPNILPNRQARTSNRVMSLAPATLSTMYNIVEGVTSDGLYGRDSIYEQAPSSGLPDGGRLQSPIILDPAEYGTEHQQGARTTTRERIPLHSSEGASIKSTESSSQQPDVSLCRATTAHICGEENVANIATTSSQPTQVVYDGAKDAEDVQLHNTHSTAIARTPMWQTPRSSQSSLPSPRNLHNVRTTAIASTPVWQVPKSLGSPLPSPIVTGSWNTKSLTSEIDSRGTVKSNVQRTRVLGSILLSIDAAHLLGELNEGSTVSWNSGNAVQYHTGARQNFPGLGNQFVFSDVLPAISMITSLGIFSLAAQRPAAARSSSLVKSAQSVVSGALEGLTAGVLMFCIAALVPSHFVSFLAMSALPILAGCIQLHQSSLSSEDSHLSDHTLSHAFPKERRPQIDLTTGFKAGYAKILHLIRCDLAKKLIPDTHTQTSPKARISRPQPPRVFARWAVTSHV
ncbi:hypothetical protein F5Y03DRAFT_229792 [Xylaria venustula]|nr:hypothetical protein F5Y03DRAFT_229792 [Xylaria venustula]